MATKKKAPTPKKSTAKPKAATQTAPILVTPAPEPSPRPVRNYLRLLSLLSGMAIVSLWTMLRSITNGVNFDVVGQIGLAEQWAHGIHAGAQLGSTNYLLKIPAYVVVNRLSFLSPHHRLIVLALLFNLLTFLLLFILFEKTRRLYHVKQSAVLYFGIVWLATIAGGVYWLDYANSRNLETVGGVLFLYLALKLAKTWRWSTLLALLLTAIVVFFADPLQAYICGGGVVLYAVLRILVRRSKADRRYTLGLILATVVGFVGALDLQQIATSVLHVSFLVPPKGHTALSINAISSIGQGLVRSTLEIFDANFLKRPYTPNSLRQLLNAVVLVALIGLVLRVIYVRRKRLAHGPWLLVIVIAINYGVYVASGQVLVAHTSRYLVMTPLLVLMMLAIIPGQTERKLWRRVLLLGWSGILIISTLLLVGAVVVNWPSRYSKDTHIDSLISFLHHEGFKYALASRETGVTTTYFSGGNITVLPVGCDGQRMQLTNLFYDSGSFARLKQYYGDVPILLQSNAIKFGINECDKSDIIKQFGVPIRELSVPGYGTALVYSALSINQSSQPPQQTASTSSLLRQFAQNVNQTTADYASIMPLMNCEQGTIDVVVAHPDDDLLFMNPALSNQLSTKCLRTIFVTAADDGRSKEYWLGRQSGVEAAYAAMSHVDNVWSDQTALIHSHRVFVRTLTQKPSLSLVFMRLPDGNVHGQGFAATGSLSLELISRNNMAMRTVDNTDSYTYQDAAVVVSDIIKIDQPSIIYTHVTGGALSSGDHSDHRTVGRLTVKAATLAKSTAAFNYFVGYPSNTMAKNLSLDDAANKRMIFDTYANYDGTICVAGHGCSVESTFGKYLDRCYRQSNLKKAAPCLDATTTILPPK